LRLLSSYLIHPILPKSTIIDEQNPEACDLLGLMAMGSAVQIK